MWPTQVSATQAGWLELFSLMHLCVLHPQLSYVMSGYRCFVCPVEYNNDTNSFTVDCEPSDLFRLQEYVIPGVIQSIIGWVCATHMGWTVLSWIMTTKKESRTPHCFPSKDYVLPSPVMSFAFSTLSTFATMVQKLWWVNLLAPWCEWGQWHQSGLSHWILCATHMQ